MPNPWAPSQTDPLFILAMDHRDSFGTSLFGVEDDSPTPEQRSAMERAKRIMYEGLLAAAPQLTTGRAGVLVDEQYGQGVVDAAGDAPVVLAVPIEASGHDWFTLQFGDDWLAHVDRARPDYAKILVRDNPDFDKEHREEQLAALNRVSHGLAGIGVPLLYELLVPATDEQLADVGKDADRYDAELRPELVVRVMSDNQLHGVDPALWKVEGLDTVGAATLVATQAKAGGRHADLIVLGRDAPTERLDHWLEVAAQVPGFVGFAIGRSIWEDVVRELEASPGPSAEETARSAIAQRYLDFASHWTV
jgi:myo-inositol catabolism protein IolC